MSVRRDVQAKEDAFASGAKPRLEERVREPRWRPTNEAVGLNTDIKSAARPRAIDQRPTRERRLVFGWSGGRA
jgi:hypothetical protein